MSSLIKNISSYSGAVILQKVIAFFYFTVIARSLGPEGAGGYFLGVSLAQFFATFADLGIVNYLIRETSQDPKRLQTQFAEFMGVRTVVNILAYLGVIGSAIALGYSSEVVWIAVLAGISMTFDSFSTLFFGVLRAHHTLKVESVSILVFQILELLGSILVMAVTRNPLLLAVVLVGASMVHLTIATRALYRMTPFRIGFRISWTSAKGILTQSIPFAFIAIFARLYTQADILMLSKMNCALLNCHEIVGLYTVGVKATLAIQSIPLSFMAAIYPAMSEWVVKDRARVNALFFTTLRFLGIFGVAAIVFFLLIGQSVVSLVWGEAFVPAVSSIAILLFGSVFVIASFPCGALLNASKRQRAYAVFIFVALAVNVVLNIFFIRWWSYPGAAWASFVGSVVLFILEFGYLVRTWGLSVRGAVRALVPTVCAGGLVLVLMKSIPEFSWVITVGLGVFLFIGFLFLFRAVSVVDIRSVWDSFRAPHTPPPLEPEV